MKSVSQTPNANSVIQWVNWADRDYIAARKLFNANLIVQGCSLANTAIEKYLKAILLLIKFPIPKGYKGHDISNLYSQVVVKFPKLKLNEEFLEMLVKVYKLRYPDGLEIGYNVSLCSMKILIELDHSVFEIRSGFHFQKSDGTAAVALLDSMLQDHSNDLLENNTSFGSTLREDIFNNPLHVYEMRVISEGNFLEAYYQSKNIKDDNIFNAEGLKPG